MCLALIFLVQLLHRACCHHLPYFKELPPRRDRTPNFQVLRPCLFVSRCSALDHHGSNNCLGCPWMNEILIPVEAESLDPSAQPAKSEWPLNECQDVKAKTKEMKNVDCVCNPVYQICQPLQMSAAVNKSITLPCSFSYGPDWETTEDAQVSWRLGGFHSNRYLFKCCQSETTFTDSEFEGRVSLAREGHRYTASIHITALKESDSQFYFCRVSVKTRSGERKEWQTINGTNLTVTASPQKPEERDPITPLPLGLLVGVSIGAILLVAAIISGLVKCLLTRRKGHCPKRTQNRRAASGGQEEKEAEEQKHHCKGATAPPWKEPVSPPPPIHPQATVEPGLVYASLALSEVPKKKQPVKMATRAEEETTYAAVRH